MDGLTCSLYHPRMDMVFKTHHISTQNILHHLPDSSSSSFFMRLISFLSAWLLSKNWSLSLVRKYRSFFTFSIPWKITKHDYAKKLKRCSETLWLFYSHATPNAVHNVRVSHDLHSGTEFQCCRHDNRGVIHKIQPPP